MKKAAHFCSHLPVLYHALERTSGDVLELGTGLFSTPFLHYHCVPRGRTLISVDNNAKWLEISRSFEHPQHQLILTNDWHLPELERPFDVVFIDHAPPEQRKVDLLKYANLAKFIVIHDTNGRQDRHYHLREVWSQFRNVYHYGKFFPQTTIVSNFEKITHVD